MLIRRILGTFLFLQILLAWYGPPVLTWGESVLRGGGQPQVQLQFRIVIPHMLFLQLGSADPSLDVLGFNTADMPSPDKIAVEPQQIPVRVSGSVPGKQPIVLTVNEVRMLSGISLANFARNDSLKSNGDLQNAVRSSGNHESVRHWKGSGNRTGTHSFSYPREGDHLAGNACGRVIYTLSSP
jgi:hypothetical protein